MRPSSSFTTTENVLPRRRATSSAYLAGVLRKRAITLYRKNSVRKWEELTDEYENGDSQIEKMAENLDLQQALSALKPDELELIRMKYYEGMTVQEIAASLNISYETAKKRHQRTLSKLQKMLLLVLAMVLAGLCTACAIRILQHFGIIPGYGINQDQEERVYVLEEPVEAESTDGSLGHRGCSGERRKGSHSSVDEGESTDRGESTG